MEISVKAVLNDYSGDWGPVGFVFIQWHKVATMQPCDNLGTTLYFETVARL